MDFVPTRAEDAAPRRRKEIISVIIQIRRIEIAGRRNHAPLAQLDRASGYEPEGREFESLQGAPLP